MGLAKRNQGVEKDSIRCMRRAQVTIERLLRYGDTGGGGGGRGGEGGGGGGGGGRGGGGGGRGGSTCTCTCSKYSVPIGSETTILMVY